MTRADGWNGGKPPSQQVIFAVADELGTAPTDLEPLYYTLDPQILDELFHDRSSPAGHSQRQLSFTYAGQRVSVSDDGSVEVTPGAGEPGDGVNSALSHSSDGESEAPD